jgi:hypothetical protein
MLAIIFLFNVQSVNVDALRVLLLDYQTAILVGFAGFIFHILMTCR